MSPRSILAAALFVAVTGVSFAGTSHEHQPKGKPNAFHIFEKSCQKYCKYNVVALIDQRDPLGKGWQRVKVVRDKHGDVSKWVISPMRFQGVKSMDDGKRWRTLLPDEKVVLDQPSPSEKSETVEQRLRLAHRNYRFLVTGEESVAERPCYRIEVKPVYRELPAWTLYLDSSTCYPLREDSENGGASQIEFVSRAVSYPKEVDSEQFSWLVPDDYKTLSYDRPLALTSSYEATQRLGFTPIKPGALPFGFVVQDMEINQAPSWQSLIFRLTDGMSRASVYEFSVAAGSRGMRSFQNSSGTTLGDVRILVVSQVSESCRKKLLASFVAARL